MLMFNLMPSSHPNSLNACEANCRPLSDIALSGRPKHLYSEVSRMVPICSAVIVLLHDSKITPFIDPWSTMTMIESNPSETRRSVIKSMVRRENGWGCSAETGWSADFVGVHPLKSVYKTLHPSFHQSCIHSQPLPTSYTPTSLMIHLQTSWYLPLSYH